nr:MAG TPA: Myeloperoxidase [Caudoviricetes sp.]
MESMEEQLKDKRSSWGYYRDDIQREDHGITYITGIPYQSTIEPSINLAVDSGVLPKKYAKYLNKDRPGSIALEDLQEIIDIFKKKGINSPTNLLSYIKNDGITVSKEEWEEA